MKTNRALTLIAGLFFSTLLIFSCQKNVESNTEENSVKANQSSVVISEPVVLPDCSSVCIAADGPYNETSGSCTQSWGGPNSDFFSKTVSYVAYNTGTDFVVKVTYVETGQNNASNLVQVTVNGSVQSVATLANGATATFNFPLPSGWQKCDLISFAVHQEGQNRPVDLLGEYHLYEVCPSGCETSFTGEAKSCTTQREAVYTFISKDAKDYVKIQGGLTNFTGADAVVTVNGGKLISSQWTPGGSSNRIIKLEGSVDACEVITITITWNSTNSGGIITGNWSIKDANGVDIAPAIVGLQCQ